MAGFFVASTSLLGNCHQLVPCPGRLEAELLELCLVVEQYLGALGESDGTGFAVCIARIPVGHKHLFLNLFHISDNGHSLKKKGILPKKTEKGSLLIIIGNLTLWGRSLSVRLGTAVLVLSTSLPIGLISHIVPHCGRISISKGENHTLRIPLQCISICRETSML
jgi:hypothetical protein